MSNNYNDAENYCKCREGVGMVEKYPWEKGESNESEQN